MKAAAAVKRRPFLPMGMWWKSGKVRGYIAENKASLRIVAAAHLYGNADKTAFRFRATVVDGCGGGALTALR